MATQSNRIGKKSKERKPEKYLYVKVAAIPVLLCILLYCLFWSDSPEPTTAVRPVKSPKLASGKRSGQSASNTPQTQTQLSGRENQFSSDNSTNSSVSKWPDVSLAFLDRNSPFRDFQLAEKESQAEIKPPERVKSPSQQLRESAIMLTDQLAKQPLKYLFSSSDREVIMLGEKLIERGARISPNAEVSNITRGHLVVRIDPNAQVSEVDSPVPTNDSNRSNGALK